eukprot:9411897-Alexandrium_andersonii.AAC.1
MPQPDVPPDALTSKAWRHELAVAGQLKFDGAKPWLDRSLAYGDTDSFWKQWCAATHGTFSVVEQLRGVNVDPARRTQGRHIAREIDLMQ